MTLTWQILFWGAVGGLAYIYAGYPLLVIALGRLCGRRIEKRFEPRTVSVVIAVHNEARHLQRKITGLLALDRSECLTEILIGADGCTDGTARIIYELNEPRVRLVEFAERRGKPAVLNDLVPQCRGEIVLLTDARQEFDREFLTACLANFADPKVGVVSGELVLRANEKDSTAAEGIGLYWRYEKLIRKSESRFRGVPGATGACYAIRRDLFRPIAADTILDDVAIPLHIVVQGYRCVFESAAIAYDRPSQSTEQEAIRKRRTIAGAAQLARLYPQWLSPFANPLWLEFVSHKLLRLASPALMYASLLSNAALLPSPFFATLMALQIAFYLAAGCGWWTQQTGRRSRLFGTALMFLALNWTTGLAVCDALLSRYRVTWTKAAT
ncbi:MAG TPA: glycosyltransferase family 2 protein [Planctomycetaceae bacterium]|nr:glycosyltransferase family 2 protein [Planctomycetaceae bacterium]